MAKSVADATLGLAIDRLYKFFAPALHKGLPQSEAELQSAQPLFWCVRKCFLAKPKSLHTTKILTLAQVGLDKSIVVNVARSHRSRVGVRGRSFFENCALAAVTCMVRSLEKDSPTILPIYLSRHPSTCNNSLGPFQPRTATSPLGLLRALASPSRGLPDLEPHLIASSRNSTKRKDRTNL